jgi:nitroreductase
MNLHETILTRRTIKEFAPKPISDAVVLRALEAGLWAQNHRMTEPWRFIIVGPQMHAELGHIDAKLLGKPCIVVVTCLLSQDADQHREDYAAVCCAIQNIQLAAWAEGVGMQWSTGKLMRLPETYARLAIDPTQAEIVGFLYFGYPASIPAPKPRKPLAEVMRRVP